MNEDSICLCCDKPLTANDKDPEFCRECLEKDGVEAPEGAEVSRHDIHCEIMGGGRECTCNESLTSPAPEPRAPQDCITGQLVKAAEDDWLKKGRVGQYHGHVAAFIREQLASAPPAAEPSDDFQKIYWTPEALKADTKAGADAEESTGAAQEGLD